MSRKAHRLRRRNEQLQAANARQALFVARREQALERRVRDAERMAVTIPSAVNKLMRLRIAPDMMSDVQRIQFDVAHQVLYSITAEELYDLIRVTMLDCARDLARFCLNDPAGYRVGPDGTSFSYCEAGKSAQRHDTI